MALGWVEDHYIRPVFHFHYFGFSWLPVFPGWALYTIHGIMFLAALALAFGWRFRFAALLLFLTFTYTELIDLTYYLNHYYFVSLACLLFCLAPLPRFQGSYYPFGVVPRWSIAMFQVLLGLVYVFAGIAKINSDWLLEALPLKIWLPAHTHLPIIGNLFTWKPTAYIFSWAGMIYDCTIPFFLLWSRTRPFAYFLVVAFHLMTGFLFQIGVFPVVMIGATLIFFSTGFHEKLLVWIKNWFGNILFYKSKTDSRFGWGNSGNYVLAFLGLFFAFQLLFPFRYLAYPGNIFWTEEGYRFSWRVMLIEKAGTAHFYVKDNLSGKEGLVNNADFLNAHQEKQMAMQPDMILQFAHFLGRYYEKKGMFQPGVRAEVYVTLNGKPSRLLLDDQIDLMTVSDGWAPKTWITTNENPD